MIPSRFAVTLTPSTDHRIFFLKSGPVEKELEKGTYVMFDIRSEYIANGVSQRVIKRIACGEEEDFSRIGDTFYCNGNKIGVAKSRSLTGMRLPRFFFNGRIPAGMIFVAGQHRDSYDSRYFGFLRKEEVQAIAYPLL